MEGHFVFHTRFQLSVRIRSGITVDDALIRSGLRPMEAGRERNVIFLPLVGETILRCPDRSTSIHEGELRAEIRNRSLGIRQEGEQLLLVLEWEPGSLGTRRLGPGQTLRLPPTTLRHMRSLAREIASYGSDERRVRDAMHEILARLRAEGLPLDPLAPEDLEEPLPDWIRPLSAAIDWGVSNLARNPSLDELAARLGWSPRHVLRSMRKFHRRYGTITTGGWRDVLRLWRIATGAALMSHPKATTEAVAHQLGYARPGAFRAALANAGLPSPGNIRDALRRLS